MCCKISTNTTPQYTGWGFNGMEENTGITGIRYLIVDRDVWYTVDVLANIFMAPWKII